MTLQFGAVSSERCFAQLSTVPDLAGISRGELDLLVEHMKAEDFLFFRVGGLLSHGPARRAYLRQEELPLELYAVFSSPVLYRVKTGTGLEYRLLRGRLCWTAWWRR